MIDENFDNKPQPSQTPDEYAALHAENAKKSAAPKEGWEREVLEKLVFATLNEQRARRRWNIFFKFVTFAFVLWVIWLAFDFCNNDIEFEGRHTAFVVIDVTIE